MDMVTAEAAAVMVVTDMVAADMATQHLCANRCFIHSVNHCRSCLFRWRLLLTTQHEIDQPYTAGHSFRCTFVKKSDIIYILSFRSEVS